MSELVGPALEVKREPDLIIKGMQHNQIQETDWSRCLVLNNNIKYRSRRLTGGSVFTAPKSCVLWFEASYLQKVILIKPTNFLCNEMVANEFDCLKFEFLRRTRMKKRASGIQFPLKFLPLQQKWMQTISGKSREKISLILVLGLCNQNMHIYPTERNSRCCWLPPVIVFSGSGLGMASLHLWVSWYYAYLLQKCSQWVCVGGCN